MKDLVVDISWKRGVWEYRFIWNRKNGAGASLDRYSRKLSKSERVWPKLK